MGKNVNEKHLEFLQNNISRMNQCSFQMKGWAITLASALVAVFAATLSKENVCGNRIYIFVAVASTILFWILDSMYLSKERKFVGMYNDVIGISNGTKKKRQSLADFEIAVEKYTGWRYCIFRAMLSPTEIILYGVVIIGLVVLALFA